jgi:ubiquinone/menaquinone biosynthesis C-methylase UbiE
MSDQGRVFGKVAESYDRGRPGYPRQAVEWLVGSGQRSVLELGAGTGKLTEQLLALGHGVVATDPDTTMLDRLKRNLPDASTLVAHAEDLPVGDHGFDAVVAAQAFHWFDLERALPEIARVLRPKGRVCLVWNQRNEKIPWVRRLGALIGTQEQLRDPAEALIFSELFGFVEDREFSHWQLIDRQTIQDLVLSRSNIAVLDADGRAAKLAEVLAFYDEYGRGMDGMQLPYVTKCYRAHVLDRPVSSDPESARADDDRTDGETEGPEDDMLLIDFR